jgi:Na+/H+-dicarboxylate symporter
MTLQVFSLHKLRIDLDIGTQMTCFSFNVLTSNGIAGVPRASLVVVATCGMFDISIEGIALYLPLTIL